MYERSIERPDCHVTETSDRLSPMAVQRELVEHFARLELALNDHQKKGTPKGDPTYSRIYTQLARDLAPLGIARDGIPEAAKSCGRLGTFERLEQHT